MRAPFFTLGIFAFLIGTLWIGQGTGLVNWPKSSFMISQMQWAYYGAALAALGVGTDGTGARAALAPPSIFPPVLR